MIPRIVHRIWIGGEEPDWLRPFAQTWHRPGWGLREWTDANVDELFPLTNQRLFDEAPAIAPDHVGQLRSDVLRYEILHRFGGVYVDADLECLQPIDPLIHGLDAFAAWEVQGAWIANGFMGAREHHHFLASLIGGLADNVARFAGSKPNKMSGPQYLTRAWKSQGRPIEILDQANVYPYGFAEIGSKGPGDSWPVEAFTVHHWANKRRGG